MRSRSDFLQGLVAGVIAGLGLAALLRSETGQRMLASLQNGSQQRPYASDSEYPHSTPSPILLRERPERGGNPERLSPEKSSYSSTAFERPSAVPGSPTGPDPIAVPGRSGETADISDPSQGVRPAGRTIHVPQAEKAEPES
jgi:hypothetical protein